MNLDELAKLLGVDLDTAFTMNHILEGNGFNEDQAVSIMKLAMYLKRRKLIPFYEKEK